MADGELKDMEHFFSTLPNPFSDSEVYKTSVVGQCQLIITYINTSVTTAGRKVKIVVVGLKLFFLSFSLTACRCRFVHAPYASGLQQAVIQPGF